MSDSTWAWADQGPDVNFGGVPAYFASKVNKAREADRRRMLALEESLRSVLKIAGEYIGEDNQPWFDGLAIEEREAVTVAIGLVGDEGRPADDLRFTSVVDNVTCGKCLALMALAASDGGVVCVERHAWASETECGGNVKRHETPVGTIWECERCGRWRSDRDIATMSGVRART